MRTDAAATDLLVQSGNVLRVLLPAPQVNPGFQERQPVTFIGPPDKDCRLLIDDEPLALTSAVEGRGWMWEPGFFAGEVTAELRVRYGEVLGRWRLDVSPDPLKLGGEMFREMVAELLKFDPELVLGQEPARSRLGSLSEHQNPLVALARLRIHSEGIFAAFSSVIREPIKAIRPRRCRVPLQAVRRVDRRSILTSMRRPALLAVLKNLESDLIEQTPNAMSVDVPEVEQHLDSSANRCLRAILGALDRRYADTYERLSVLVSREAESETVTGLARRWDTWSEFLERGRLRIRSVLRRSPFNEVTRSEITAAGLNAIAADPLYARAWRCSWLALRMGVDGSERDDLLPLSPTWEIYERWCYMRILQILQQDVADVTWTKLDPAPHGAFIGWEARSHNGSPVIQLLLQPRFPSTSGIRSSNFWSVSRERYPDIVLSHARSAEHGLVVFDAKYRVLRSNVLDAMESAHIYQDSLRRGDRRPQLSLLLVPSTKGVEWLEHPQFASTHGVGTVALGESGPPQWFRELLAEFLEPSAEVNA